MPPKKSHGPRGKAAAGPPKHKTPDVPDSDHIVFTSNQSSSKPKPKDDGNSPPRPDVKKIIGGASWTGKLPVNLLSEHCQREKWNKPEYLMRTVPQAEGGGHRSMVKLSATNPKTRKTTMLPPFDVPASHRRLANQPTPLEARHFAAAYALFRVSSMKNIHMTLPPQYRDLWKDEFTKLKQGDVDAGRAWRYDADPFAAARETQRILDDIEKQKAKKVAEATASASTSLTMVVPGHGGDKRSNRLWDRACKVDMGDKIRVDIEGTVRRHAVWNAYGVTLSKHQKTCIVDDLSKLGFRRSHVQEGVQQCKDREETLEWLLVHVPEDDLPPRSFPERYSAGITLASGDLAKEGKLKRLVLAGYSMDMAAKALEESSGDENHAAEKLQATLVVVDAESSLSSRTPLGVGNSVSGSEQQWKDEMLTLEAIFGDRFAKASATCTIASEAHTGVIYHFTRSRSYPFAPPVIAICAGKMPAYIRLSATRQALLYAYTLLGDAMIFGMVEWLETNLQIIVEDPGPLSDVMALQQDQSGLQTRLGKPKGLTWHQRRQPDKAGVLENVARSDTETKIKNNACLQQARNQALKQAWEARQSTPAQQHMIKARQSLPAWSMREAILDAIGAHQCVIISGETGSGKSTQSVQFVLDHLVKHSQDANILCTQPRRISAIGLAERVSNERCTKTGEEIGYVIRGETKTSHKTKITFMTTGVLLRRMQSAAGMINSLQDVTHIFVDEVHERTLDTDFLLALLRDAMRALPRLTVVLMSATLDAQVFSDYFGRPSTESPVTQVGQAHISGQTFPVKDLYLDDILKFTGCAQSSTFGSDDEDKSVDFSTGKHIQNLGMSINYELIGALVRHINEELGTNRGGILIFLPGTLEIEKCLAAVRNVPSIYGLPLHASLLPAEQRRVFQPPPQGMRKVLCATNVAETSITIEDIVAVIDSGRVKETSYDPQDNMVRLSEVWASKAACKQRRGRAGRVSTGTCYKLFTRCVEAMMASQPEPEIRRVPLEQLCLAVKATGSDRDVAHFLRQTLTPPEEGAVEAAMSLLHRMGALENDRLTALGRHLTMIPADLRCAKLLVYASIFGCMEACLTVAAILAVRSPFVSYRDKREEAKTARQAFSSGHGDLLLDLHAYNEWSAQIQQRRYGEIQDWCSKNFLSQHTLREISSTRSQLLSSLKDAGIVPLDYRISSSSEGEPFNTQNENYSLLRTLIAGALSPQIAKIDFPDKKFAASMTGAVEMDPEARTIKYFNQENGRVFVHPSSTLFDAQTYSGSAAYLAYFSKIATSKTFVRDLTPFNAYGLLLFGGAIEIDTAGRGLIVDGWLHLRAWARIGVLASRLRTLLDEALKKRIDQPAVHDDDTGVIGIVRRLVEFNGQDR